MYDREGWAILAATFTLVAIAIYLIPRIIG
jgi:hypothetical protein